MGGMRGVGRKASAELTERTQPLDLRIARLADAQHGVVSLEQLRAHGLSDSAVRMRVAAGRLHRVHRGVYAVGRARLDARGRRMAAVLACGTGAVLSHRTAADALGLLPSASSRIEVTVPGRSRRNRPGVTIHRSPALRPDDCTQQDGIPCTNPARTLLDLAAVVSAATLAQAIEAAERIRLFDGEAVTDVLARAAGRPAARRLRAALAAYFGGPVPTRRELERRALQLFDQAGLPRPRVNSLVPTGEGPLEVDFCWPDRRLVVEADTFEFHGTRAAFERDRRRDQLLRSAGWAPVRITWRQVNQAPGEVAAAVRTDTFPGSNGST
jgi:predicted transcriptional regulator of viral defense system